MQRALILGAVFVVAGQTALVFSMLVGSALADPGGAMGIVMIVAPVLVAAGLVALAWRYPRLGASIVLAVGIAATVVAFVNARTSALPEWFGGYAHVIVVTAFVVIAAYAMRRPALGGSLLLFVAAVVTIATPEIALFLAGPPALAGVLFLGAAWLQAEHPRPQHIGRVS